LTHNDSFPILLPTKREFYLSKHACLRKRDRKADRCDSGDENLLDWEKQALGEACIATSVVKFSGEIVAAISISAPASSLDQTNPEELARPLLRAGQDLSEKFGFKNGK
jgi:hypothetical protein